MATPRNVSKSTPAGVKLRAGRFSPSYVSILDQLAAATPGTFVKVNTNRYEDAWEDIAFRTPWNNRSPTQAQADLGTPSSPKHIINAWCSFAWDDDRMTLILFGGGHANGSNSEVYTWDASTTTWRLAYHASSLLYINDQVGFRATGGWLDSPTSAHTYSNNAFLPKSNRFISWGGANQHGEHWLVADDAGVKLRTAGPFTLDMKDAYKGYVAGSTGTNVKRAGTASEGVSLTGTNAWRNRDWRKDHPLAGTAMLDLATTGRTVCVTEENGRDVVYFQGNNGTSKDLFRLEIVDINDYKQDLITWVGYRWSNQVSDSPGAYDPKRKFFFNPSFYTSTIPDFIGGWDLRPGKAGDQNKYISCPPANVVGPDAAEFISNANQDRYSSVYDERRDKFVVLSLLQSMYEITPPNDFDYTKGWSVKKIEGASKFSHMGPLDDVYLCGRFRRSKKLDVYIYLRDIYDGNVWMYKPVDWLDPRNA